MYTTHFHSRCTCVNLKSHCLVCWFSLFMRHLVCSADYESLGFSLVLAMYWLHYKCACVKLTNFNLIYNLPLDSIADKWDVRLLVIGPYMHRLHVLNISYSPWYHGTTSYMHFYQIIDSGWSGTCVFIFLLGQTFDICHSWPIYYFVRVNSQQGDLGHTPHI